jgi:hypothetical protein
MLTSIVALAVDTPAVIGGTVENVQAVVKSARKESKQKVKFNQ